jgi:hypothetical protein
LREIGIEIVEDQSAVERRQPKKGYIAWSNEKRAGVKLLYAEERKGKDDYIALRPIREMTGQGWERVGINDVLEEIED